MSRSYMPSHGGRTWSTATIALVAAASVVVVGGVAGAITLTGGSGGNAHMAGSLSSHGWTAPGISPGAPSFAAVANVTPPVAATACTTPSTFTYSGTLSAAGPGTVTYQWVYSSGRAGPVRTVDFAAAGQHRVTGDTVTTKTAGGGWGEIKVISPVASTSGRAAYKLLCGGSSAGGVTVTAAVTPATRTASCGTAVPPFTAVGSIEASKAETVTYYWAQSDGRDSAPATLAFTGPGTKTAVPLTITPPGASGSGEAVLVVTSPVAAASAPARYALTCKAPSASAASGPASPASGPATTGHAPTTPAGSPTSPSGDPSAPADAPATTPSSPPGNAGSGSMYIPINYSLDETMQLGTNVSSGIEVVGGTAPYAWSITGLPPGITQEPQGYGSTAVAGITGTAETPGTYRLTMTVTDSEQPPQTLTEHYTLVVLQPSSEPWTVISFNWADAVVGTPFSGSFGVTGQTSGLTVSWAVTGGTVPPGLSLNPVTGALTGTPTQRGSYIFYVVATNVATGATKQGAGSFNVYPAGTVI